MAQIIEVNGEPVEFPDDMTDDQIASVIKQQADHQGAATSDPRLPADRPTDIGLMPNGASLPYGITPEMIAAQNKTNAQNNEQNTQRLNDQSFMSRVAKADESGSLSNMGSSLMNTLNQFATGGEEMIDKYLPNAIAKPLNYRFGGELPYDSTAEQRMAVRKAEMENNASDEAARGVASPISSTIGAMAPYITTGGAANRVLDALAGVVSPVTRQLIQSGLSKIAPLEGTRFANLPRIPSEFGKRAGYMAKAPLIGAAEGGLNYDQTAAQGALMSTAGSALGLIGPLTKLSRVENVRDANSKKLIQEMHGQGFSLTPGIRTGNRAMQTEEAGMKNSDVLGDYYHQSVTRPNQQKITEMAGDAIGLNGKGRDTFGPEELSKHMDDLSAGYKQLEATTSGKFTQPHMKVAGDVLTDLRPTATRNTSPDDAMRYAKVKSITDQIKAESIPGPGVSGALNRSFDGSQYQVWRQRIQDEASQAFQSGDSRLGNAMNKLKNNLDSALEQSMGKAKASEWKDLNERYAMTNLLLKKGMTPQGAIDPMGITSAVMKDDEAIRTLTGKGGRIQQLQKIAKYNDVLNNVEGGSLTGLGKADMSADRSLTKLPIKYRLPLYARTTGAYRLSRLPTYGLGPTSGMQAGRAIGMTDPTEKVGRAAMMTANDLRDWLKGGE